MLQIVQDSLPRKINVNHSYIMSTFEIINECFEFGLFTKNEAQEIIEKIF
jgi:hypothetical protein